MFGGGGHEFEGAFQISHPQCGELVHEKRDQGIVLLPGDACQHEPLLCVGEIE